MTKDYNEYETNFRYEEIDFVSQYFNMIRFFQSNPNDAFLIGDLIYFFMSMSKNFLQSVEISDLLSGKSLYLVKNGKLFIDHTFDNYEEYLDR